MTREEFIERWRLRLVGLGLYGLVIETTETNLVRAGHALRIPAQVERILGQMFDDLRPKPPADVIASNGRPMPNGVKH